MSERSLLLGYYLAMASIFEPERSKERLAWAKTSALIEAITAKFQDGRAEIVRDQIRAFISEFMSNVSIDDYQGKNKTREVTLVETLRETLNQLSLDALLAHGRDIHQYLHQAVSIAVIIIPKKTSPPTKTPPKRIKQKSILFWLSGWQANVFMSCTL